MWKGNYMKRILLITLCVFTGAANAIIHDAGERRERRTPVVSTPGASTSRSVARPTTSARTVCEDSNYMPLQLVSMMSDDSPAIRITSNVQSGDQDKVVSFQVGNLIKACVDLQAEVTQPESNTVAVSFKNEFNFESELLGQSVELTAGQPTVLTRELLSSMTMNEKYEACLRKKGILTGYGSGTKIERPQVDTEYTTVNFNNTAINFNPNEQLKVVYASPLNLGRAYGAAFDNAGEGIGGLTCNVFEEVASQPHYLHSTESVRRHRLMNICQHGTPQELKAAMTSLGNAPDLRGILENAYARQIVSYGDSKAEELETLAREIIDSRDEDSIRQAGRRYADILTDLKTNVQAPAITQLKALIEERRDADEARRVVIDARIAELNQLIGSFDKNSRRFRANDVLDKLLEFGFKSEAETIAEYRLNSHFYSRVYMETGRNASRGRGERLSASGAQRNVEQEMTKFSRRAEEAERIYYARSGERQYSLEIQGNIDRVTRNRDRQWQRDMQRIQRYQGYCQRTMFGFMQNPVKCREGQRNSQLWQRQALSRREGYNRSIGRQGARLERYTQYEAEGARARGDANGDPDSLDGIGGTSILGSYALFDDSTGGSYGGGGMDPSMYQMGPNQGGMMMGGGMAPYAGQPMQSPYPMMGGMGGMGMGM
jgi:hypothetical protein